MVYALGVDLGTTYTAAATARHGRAEVFPLGRRLAAVPSVVYAGRDGVLVGEPAGMRAVTEPERVAREFKRRVGDPVPLVLGGAPWSAEQLMARLLEWVLGRVREQEGEPPPRLVICHPANWGRFKRDVLVEAVRLVDRVPPAAMLTEPEAAAIHYASNDRLDAGDVIAVYDLGGGTFDLSILRTTDTGFEFIGEPEGIERLGGVDFDEVVYRHVLRHALDGAEPNTDDAATLASLARLRDDCVDAKEALSFDTRVAVPVVLPGVNTTVTITRSEFEDMVRPPLEQTMRALRRVLDAAAVPAERLRAVLLVGGSSRIPLVGQLVAGELGRPVAVDAHPKHPVALGAALAAWDGSVLLRPVTRSVGPARWDLPARWGPVPRSPTPVTPSPTPVTPSPRPSAPEPAAEPSTAVSTAAPAEEVTLAAETTPVHEVDGPVVPRWVVPALAAAILVVVLLVALVARTA
ncbi:MAG: Hsp70 family protein [Acidimicrobiales bacterium]